MLYTKDQPLSFMGVELGARMTVIKCADEQLFVHSPVKMTDEIARELGAMGRPAWVIAPNLMHHLYVQDFKDRFPSAKFYCAPGLEKKREDFQFDGVITNEQSFPWNPEITHVVFEGVPFYNEVVFFHAASKTLIVTDLAVNIRRTKSRYTKFILSLMGSFGKFGWSPVEKFIFIKDKKSFARSIDRVKQFNFDRVIMAHGDQVQNSGKEIFERAFP